MPDMNLSSRYKHRTDKPMDRYIISSIRVGEIGTAFIASPSDDIEWLLAGGFIQRSDTHPSKGAKLATKPDEPKSTKG